MGIKLEKLNKSYCVLTGGGKEIGSFQLDSDGSYYFWENGEVSGYWGAHTLREIADLLDKVNKKFDDEVDAYFDLIRRNEEEDARVEYRKLLNNGMFFEFYPQLSGVWKDDKNTWFDEFKELTRLKASKDSF
jgi:hypothetical protein